MQNFDLGWLFTLAGTTGLITAILNQVFGVVGGLMRNHQSARHLALQLAVAFEQYGVEAASAAGDIDSWRGSGGAIGAQTRAIPAFPLLPQSPDAWQQLNAQLRDMAMSFDGEVRSERQGVNFSYDVDQPNDDEHDEAALVANLRLARDAFDLATKLRGEYHWALPIRAHTTMARVKQQLDRLERAEAEEREQRARAWHQILGAGK